MSFENDAIIFVLGISIVSLIVIQWFCWIFQIGRFKATSRTDTAPQDESQHVRYIIANLFVNIINDFRHLLALVIVLVFAITLFVVLYKNPATEIGSAMQSVSSVFGGLIGAIIGFYFGEKSALRDNNSNNTNEIEEQIDTPQQEQPAEQKGKQTDQSEIIAIPEPEGKEGQ